MTVAANNNNNNKKDLQLGLGLGLGLGIVLLLAIGGLILQHFRYHKTSRGGDTLK